MSRRPESSPAARIAIALLLAAAPIAGALVALRQATRPRAPRAPAVRRAVTLASRDAGRPVATVVPPREPPRATVAWPPPLLNPEASFVAGWKLALGRPNARDVFFTFDDGPNPGTTDRLLDILDRHHVRAAFFVCGWRLETDEPLRSRARRILRDAHQRGHVIGNHTVHHRVMSRLTPQQVRYEIDHNADLIAEVTGEKPHLFRPPFGSWSEEVGRVVRARGNELWLWSIDSHDWQRVGDAQAVAQGVIRALGNMAGGTILLHDTHPWSVSAAQLILRWLDTENRSRRDRGRPQYVIADPGHYLEGARLRLPSIRADTAAYEAEQSARGRRDAGHTAQPEVVTDGVQGMGEPSTAPPVPSRDAAAPADSPVVSPAPAPPPP